MTWADDVMTSGKRKAPGGFLYAVLDRRGKMRHKDKGTQPGRGAGKGERNLYARARRENGGEIRPLEHPELTGCAGIKIFRL